MYTAPQFSAALKLEIQIPTVTIFCKEILTATLTTVEMLPRAISHRNLLIPGFKCC